MLLRKHLNNAKIIDITQPDFERIVNIKLEHYDEMGDLCTKYLIIELMGKHSNIIFCNEDMTIIDSIKRISHSVSSVREVLPGRDYFIPSTTKKYNPMTMDYHSFYETMTKKNMPLGKALYSNLTGISPLLANELCYRASLDSSDSTEAISESASLHLYKNLERLMEEVASGSFTNIVYPRGSSY